MIRRISLKGGDEYDALTPWRRYTKMKCSSVKRKYRRRLRQWLKKETHDGYNE